MPHISVGTGREKYTGLQGRGAAHPLPASQGDRRGVSSASQVGDQFAMSQ
jgi:hypothetical protein